MINLKNGVLYMVPTLFENVAYWFGPYHNFIYLESFCILQHSRAVTFNAVLAAPCFISSSHC